MDEIFIQFKGRRDSKDLREEIRKKQDELLDVYSLYRRTGLQWIKEELIAKAYELHFLDKDFSMEL